MNILDRRLSLPKAINEMKYRINAA